MRSQSPWKNQVCPEASGTQVFLLEQYVQEITRHKNYAAKSQVLISGIMSSPRAKRSLEEWFRKAFVCSLKAWSGLVLPAEVSLPAIHLILQQYLSSTHSFSLHPDGHFCLYPMSTPCSFSPLTTNFTWKEKKLLFFQNILSFRFFLPFFFRPNFHSTYAHSGWKIWLHSQSITAQHPCSPNIQIFHQSWQ